MSPQRKFLLLNASNMTNLLTYPYAFVQVSEIADRFNIRTIRQDLIGIPKDQWLAYLQDIFKKTDFDMVLITIRNTDTLGVENYQVRPVNKDYNQSVHLGNLTQPNYYPIEDTKALIEILRKITNLPIVVGGYAFSVMPKKLMQYLKPDYGVIGGPDDFFDFFDDIILNRNLEEIANLFYYEDNILQKGPLRFFPPAARREYTEEIIADRQAFFSQNFSGRDVYREPTIPIEVARGCSKKCIFCSEPHVKGNEVRYRDLDVIEDEINFLREHDLNEFFMICSEINAGENDFSMKLADRIRRINEERKSYEKVKWHTLYLMTLSPEELKGLRQSGFVEGGNDVVSLDDNNLKAIKAPVKTKDIINHIKDTCKLIEKEFPQKAKYSLEEQIFRHQPDLGFMKAWYFFLGNTAVTPETIRVTLKEVENIGLYEHFNTCSIIRATRMFDYIRPDDELLTYTWSMTDKGVIKAYNELYPSFVYPPSLLRHFGSSELLEEFFVLIQETYLSCRHLYKKEWNWFLANKIDLGTFFSWWNTAVRSEFDFKLLTNIPEVLEFLIFLHENPLINNIKLLFNPTPGRKTLMNFTANIAILFIFFSQEKDLLPVMKFLGLPLGLKATLALSPYKFATILFEGFEDKDKLLETLEANSLNNTLLRFFFEYLIYLNNTPLKAPYRLFFIKDK